MLNNPPIDLGWIFEHKSIQTYFQPLISIRKQSIVGWEALSRGINRDHQLIMPLPLFAEAAAQGKTVPLDRLCRKNALIRYQAIEKPGSGNSFLFINLNTAILDQGTAGSHYLLKIARETGINPASLVIELVESKVCDIASLRQFIQIYRQHGCLIALDDMGSDSSNFDRVLQTRPDIIKIDREIVNQINSDYYKQEIFKALVSVAQKTGALVVAEGIETDHEAITCLELGADFLQGYYFARPAPFIKDLDSIIVKTMRRLMEFYRSAMMEKICHDTSQKRAYQKILNKITHQLADLFPDQFERQLQEISPNYVDQIYYMYILDVNGKQITDTLKITHTDISCQKKYQIFQPDCRGADQSLKKDYFFINAGYNQYVGEPYVSHANGCQCVTGSMVFACKGQSYILCIDFIVN